MIVLNLDFEFLVVHVVVRCAGEAVESRDMVVTVLNLTISMIVLKSNLM